ncbi:MAG: FKBP-type peptidyl-prolyl cis-trans isomerase [Bacteroidales bacterium]|jgi:FKBP-type peptidyl-prolyl cis-trans isomerase FklB|nr:FKBP-type peptidyl-prolyl cis-trans isomerase [Bacteroidales bacterium]
MLLSVACNNPVATVKPPEAVSEEQLLQAHKKLALDEQIEIDAFIRRAGLKNIKKTGSGLYVSIWGSDGVKINYGDTVKMFARTTLINGDKIFEGWQEIIVGKTEMIQGLREALQLISYGDSTLLIIPSHLAYGFSGDGNTIPARATLLYELKISNE